MDELNISSPLLKGAIARALQMAIKKKTDVQVGIRLNDNVSVVHEPNGKAKIHLDICVDLDNMELIKILKKFGLG